MKKRKIVEIDEEKCNGCGICIPACHEGAIEIREGKARLIDDKFCDGLGDCLGECPQDAIRVIEREAKEYDELAVQEKMSKNNSRSRNGMESKTALSGHSHHHSGNHGGCPGSRMMDLRSINKEHGQQMGSACSHDRQGSMDDMGSLRQDHGTQVSGINAGDIELKIKSQLQQWPVQLMLVPEKAPYFDNTELLLSADCVSVAYPDYQLDLLKGKAVAMGCPKLDDNNYYVEKLTNILINNDIKGITVAIMEVPCCSGLLMAAETALKKSGKNIPLTKIRIGVQGNKEYI